MGKFEKPKNPAMNYVSSAEPEKIEQIENQKNFEGKEIIYIEVPVPREIKSVRKGLLLYPSVHDKILELAEVKGISFNDFANEIFKDYIRTHK